MEQNNLLSRLATMKADHAAITNNEYESLISNIRSLMEKCQEHNAKAAELVQVLNEYIEFGHEAIKTENQFTQRFTDFLTWIHSNSCVLGRDNQIGFGLRQWGNNFVNQHGYILYYKDGRYTFSDSDGRRAANLGASDQTNYSSYYVLFNGTRAIFQYGSYAYSIDKLIAEFDKDKTPTDKRIKELKKLQTAANNYAFKFNEFYDRVMFRLNKLGE